MTNLLLRPIQRIINNPSLVALLLFAAMIWIVFYFVGDWILPVIIAMVIAYLLEGLIAKLQRLGIHRIWAVCLVFLAFSSLIAYIIFALFPILINQTKELIDNLPTYAKYAQDNLNVLPERFPKYVSHSDVNNLITNITQTLTKFTSNLLSAKFFSSLISLMTVGVYLILVPILVFFFLKDKKSIINWMKLFLPENDQIIQDIWGEVNIQIGNYIRGKFIEILIVWGSCFIIFYFFDLKYSLLLSFIIGLSVLIPYIGATLVTIPVLIIAYIQFGASSTLYWLIAVYAIVQLLDGNFLVPIIFSEAVNIHPIAIITAVLVFGGLWGFWGVFFAIPLATLVKAIIEAWRRYEIGDIPDDASE